MLPRPLSVVWVPGGDGLGHGVVLGLLDARVVSAYWAEVERLGAWLRGGADERLVALVELDRFLSARAGMPAAVVVRLVSRVPGGFDPVTWSVSLAAAEMDPVVLASALLHENVHKEQFFLMWRLRVGDVSGPRALAVRVATVQSRVAELAWAAGGLVAGSAVFAAASAWWAEHEGGHAGERARIGSAAVAAYRGWRAAVRAAQGVGLDEARRSRAGAAVAEAERAYARAWQWYAASALEAPRSVLRRLSGGRPGGIGWPSRFARGPSRAGCRGGAAR